MSSETDKSHISSKMRRYWTIGKKLAMFSIAAMLLLALLGFVLQRRHDAVVVKKYSPQGQFASIRKEQLHYQTMGDGPVTIVLESGLAEASYDSLYLQEKLSEFGTVFAYDRPGIGWSDGEVVKSGVEHSEILHELLHVAEVPPPYVIVGASYGGLVSRIFASKYSDEVVGLVLCDAFSTDNFPRDSAVGKRPLLMNIVCQSAPIGLPQLFVPALLDSPDDEDAKITKMRIDLHRRTKAIYASIQCYDTIGKDWLGDRETLKPLGDLPVTALIPLRNKPSWAPIVDKANKAASSNVRVVEVDCGHMICHEKPSVVIDEVRNMIEKLAPTQSKGGRSNSE